MAKTVILDTHVLYDIGLNRVSIEDIRQPREHLCYSPISIIELVSKLDDRSFEDRKATAAVILKHRINELPDPESHLTMAFGYKLAEPPPSYSDAVRALATGQSLKEVQRGVPDYELRVRRRLNVPFTATWREKGEKVVWLDVGNAGTDQIADLLLRNKNQIATFLDQNEDALLILNENDLVR